METNHFQTSPRVSDLPAAVLQQSPTTSLRFTHGTIRFNDKHRAALDPLILDSARNHKVDAALVRAIVHVESGFNSQAVSPKGATGAMQLMASTALRYGAADRTNPRQNIDAGVRYLKALLERFAGNTALALAAYNAGEGAVERHARKVPPFRETMLYVPEVLMRYESYRQADESKEQ